MPAPVIRRSVSTAILSMLVLTMPVRAADDPRPIDELVNRIIELRGQVDELDSQLQQMKSEHKNRMSSLAREEGQLKAERERQQLRLKKVERQVGKEREKLAAAGVGNEELKPVIRDALGDLRGYVNTALPFKRAARLDSLDEMESQLTGGSLPPPRVANRLWSFVSDELRLASETGIYRQSVSIEGEDKLVDVARVGMMHLYFRTDDGRTGYATRQNGNWQYQYVDGSDRDRIRELMASLRKQVRTGYFKLPNPARPMELN
jgi:chorismate mutase